MVDFVVLIDNGKNQIVAEMTSSDGQIQINSFFITHQGKEYLENRLLSFSGTEYSGPIFESLDEGLQDKIYAWFNSIGITEDLAVFIETASLEHEEELYMNWMKSIENFL